MDTSSNLTPVRGPNVWTQRGWNGRDADILLRIGLAAVGVVLLGAAVRPRRRIAAPLAFAGAALLGCASQPGAWRTAREWVIRRRGRQGDVVSDASALSFPASDSPSWTTTTGSVADRTVGGF